MSAFDEMAAAIVRIAERKAEARAPSWRRFVVVELSPLVLRELDGDLTLDEDDDDVEIARAVLADPTLDEGDAVLVRQDGDSFIVCEVLD